MRVFEGRYELFHPIFQEHLKQLLYNKGIIQEYRKILGRYFYARKEYEASVILLEGIDDEKIKPHIFEVLPKFIRSGDWKISIKLLKKALDLFPDNLMIKGYAHYHLTNCYRHMGLGDKAVDAIEVAIKAFEEAKNKDWLSAALMFKAIELAEEGLGDEALALANKVMEELPETPHLKATAYVNISNVLIKVSRYEEAASAAQKAFSIFEEIKDYTGILCSLTNLSNCLVQLDELPTAIKYLEILDKIVEQNHDLVSQTVVWNSLTLCYRRMEKYELAKKYGVQTIKRCRELNLTHKVIMNIINLGNVYNDEENLEEANKLYEEGLALAKTHNYIKEIGRALELIANIRNQKEEYGEALKYATEAVEKSLKSGEYFRAAEAYKEIAFAHYKLSDLLSAAQAYEEAAKLFSRVSSWQLMINSLCRATEYYLEINKIDDVRRLVKTIFDSINESNNYIRMNDLLLDLQKIFSQEEILKLYETCLATAAFNQRAGIPKLLANYVTFCKYCSNSDGKKSFLQLLESIDEKIENENWPIFVLLAIIIEQSGDLLTNGELDKVTARLNESIKGYYFRNLGEDGVSIVVSWSNGVIFQINSFQEPIVVYKLSVVFSLMVKALECCLRDSIGIYKQKEMEIWLYPKAEFEMHIEKLPEYTTDLPAIFMMRSDYNIYLPVIIQDDYEQKTDCKKHEDNSAFLAVLASLYCHIYSQFTHVDPHSDEAREKAFKIVRSIMGVEDQTFWFKGSKLSFDLGNVSDTIRKLSKKS